MIGCSIWLWHWSTYVCGWVMMYYIWDLIVYEKFLHWYYCIGNITFAYYIRSWLSSLLPLLMYSRIRGRVGLYVICMVGLLSRVGGSDWFRVRRCYCILRWFSISLPLFRHVASQYITRLSLVFIHIRSWALNVDLHTTYVYLFFLVPVIRIISMLLS